MAEDKTDIHDGLIVEFLDDSEQMLNEVSNLFIQIEGNQHSYDAIDRIFRSVHTIKGNAAILSLQHIKKISHTMEDLMNLVRQGIIEIDREIANVLFKGVDWLQNIIQNVRDGKPEIKDQEEYQSFIMQITLVFDNARRSDPRALWANMRNDLAEFETQFSTENAELYKIWKRIAQTIVLVSPFLEQKKEKKKNNQDVVEVDPQTVIKNILSQEFEETLQDDLAEEVLSALKSLEEKVTDQSAHLIKESLELYHATVPVDGFTSFLSEIILEKIEEVVTKKRKSDFVERKNTGSDVSEDVSKSHKTMRIYEATIDHFLDLIGDLVVVGETYGHIEKYFLEEFGSIKAVTNLKKNNESFNELSLALQTGVLDIRRVPIKTLLQRAPRIIRDIVTLKNKKVRVDIKGEEILIDKSLLESVEAPFMHLIRNAADHGIENFEVRKKKGKEEEGKVLIEVVEEKDSMRICINDDGAGINKETILNSACEKGLISKEDSARFSEGETFDLLFKPGFSTAEEVTDISGRGVGMDVVKKDIEAIGGQIHIQSILNEGSSFTIEIPKTVCVRIMEGFLVESFGNRFILPMTSVGESFKIAEGDITETLGKGECILHHDTVFPLRRLNKILNLSNPGKESKGGIGVILNVGNSKIVLFVDDVLGTQQVVIKDIDGLLVQSELIAGGAVLGDEQVAIVLNLDSLE